jgi:hypothetical protein
MANIGEAARRPVNDNDDDDVMDLTGAAAGQGANRKRVTAHALPVCGALWVCAAGPHLVWNFLHACARGNWGAGWTRGGSAARTGFRARVSQVQILAVLGVDASSSSVLRLARLLARCPRIGSIPVCNSPAVPASAGTV